MENGKEMIELSADSDSINTEVKIMEIINPQHFYVQLVKFSPQLQTLCILG